ncbi:heavy-metal-associated domain-containing protein [Paenibacillus antri]|uniref:Heavy-metal-associated domain-containing protein n=1 Tax=Paenibacillus antri TaxID=2582848 RepID=A0A5R9G7C4_9BACL|nr:cation transporter [Paenibacillus antri]TLS51611.1 heavy-metal-associated domain-containing protein [Paenibacillus antri]
MKEVILSVRGMSCNHCVHSILNGLGKLGASAIVDLEAGTVTVRHDEERQPLQAIIASIEESGYFVEK